MQWKRYFKKLKKKILPSSRTSRGQAEAEIAPDEIFLDSSNLPDFNVHQFEGRLEQPIRKSTLLVVGIVFIFFGGLYVFRLWSLQVAHGASFETLSENNILHDTPIFAERGAIYDRTGKLLAWNDPNPADPNFPLREYVNMEGLSSVLGYVKYPQKDTSGVYYNPNYQGIDGVEKFYDDELAGQPGLKVTETDALGNVQSENIIQPPVAGSNITLSINAAYNQEIYTQIQALAKQKGFTGGAAAVIDIKTGEMLALVSYPEYSSEALSNPTMPGNSAAISASLADPNNEFLNRIIDGLYTPGSTVKPYMAVAAQDAGVISPTTELVTTGSISIPNPYDPTIQSVFKDWRNNGTIDMRHAIAYSSDVYFYEVGGGYENQPGLGIDNIVKYMKDFGFGSPVTSPFFTGPAGTIPDPAWKAVNFPTDPWRIGDTYHTSIGQYGWQVTPMQMLLGISTIANDGLMPVPTILKRTTAGVDTIAPPSLSSIDPTDYEVVKEGMRLGVTDPLGVSAPLSTAPFEIASKTGTAQLGTHNQFVNSWDIGFFPYQDPHYAFVFIMEQGPATNDVGALYVALQFFNWLAANNSSTSTALTLQ